MTSHKGASYAFANEVALAHVEAGFTSVRRPGEPKGLAPSERVRGDLHGLPLTVGIRNGVALDLPGAIREVKREAQAEGNDLYVSIHRRRASNGQEPNVLDSIVITDLQSWLTMLRRLHPEAVHAGQDQGCKQG